MTERMKILIGYDGSDCSEKMLLDLTHAGLPTQAEVVVLTVAEHWLAAPTSFGGVDVHFTEDPKEASETLALAQHAQSLLHATFPNWEVSPAVAWGMPASKLLERADDWQPDLLVVGSHGRSTLGRFFAGSVAQKILHEAHCSVRVARGKSEAATAPVKIIVGVDGSQGSVAAVNAVAVRHWPPGSQVRIVNATWEVPPIASTRMVGPITEWIMSENERIKKAMGTAAATLNAAGLITSSLVEAAEPKTLLCRAAETWEADSIFLGARGMGTIDRFMIGSISSGVTARAHCSVEVVRVK